TEGYIRLSEDSAGFRMDISVDGHGVTESQYASGSFEGLVPKYFHWREQVEEGGSNFNRMTLDVRTDPEHEQVGVFRGIVEMHNSLVDLWMRYGAMRNLATMEDDQIKAESREGCVDRDALAGEVDKMDLSRLR
ncbi:hypothetical protein LCGC14_2713080, partial [marine sediment metagenome]